MDDRKQLADRIKSLELALHSLVSRNWMPYLSAEYINGEILKLLAYEKSSLFPVYNRHSAVRRRIDYSIGGDSNV